MSHKLLRPRPGCPTSRPRKATRVAGVLGGLAALSGLAVSGCGSDSGPTAPVGPDLSTPERTIAFMIDAYGLQKKANAIGILDPEYTFHPAFPESIAFLGPGETSWGYDREVEILEQMLEPGRVTWLDQVLLEIEQVNKIYNADSSLVEIFALTDLLLLVGADSFLQGRGDIVYTFRRDGDGNYFLLEERESPDPTASLSVGENKARVLEQPEPVDEQFGVSRLRAGC